MIAEHSEPVRMLAGVTHHNVTAHKTPGLPGCPLRELELGNTSVSLHAVLAASLGAHRKAQHARVCFAGGRYFSKQRQLRE